MKNLFLSAIALVLSNVMFSQTSILLSNNGTAATLAANEVISINVQPETNAKVTIDIKNTGPNTQSYNAKRYDILLNADATSTAQAYFCIAGSCYGPPTMVSPTPLTLNSMQSASQLPGPYQMLVADLDEAATVGFSYVKYTFQNVNNPSDSVQISIKYNTPGSSVGINKIRTTENGMTLSPNPASEKLSLAINSDNGGFFKILLFNSLGEIVFEKNSILSSGKNVLEIGLTDLPKGIYFATVNSQNLSKTRKFIIQ